MVEGKDEAGRGGAAKQIRAEVDRVEDGGVAVLLAGEDGKTQIDFPLSLLPEGVEGGDHLRITIRVDGESRKGSEERVRNLQDRLARQGGAEGQKDFKL